MVKFSLPPLSWRCFDRYFFFIFLSGEASCKKRKNSMYLTQRWLVPVIKGASQKIICLADVGKPVSHFISEIRWSLNRIYSVLLCSWKMHECYAVWDSDG